MIRSLLCLLTLVASGAPAVADKNVEIKPKLAEISSPVITEAFDGKLAKSFQGVKGEWKIVDGALVGKELPSDKHAAVMNLQKKNRDSVVRFSFKLDDQTKTFHFSLNRKGGHLFRTIVTPTKLTINLDKDKKDPTSKAVVMASAEGSFPQGNWYTMQVEMVGDRVVVQTDNGLSAQAQNSKLDIDKPNYRFVVKAKSLSIDDLHVWETK